MTSFSRDTGNKDMENIEVLIIFFESNITIKSVCSILVFITKQNVPYMNDS